MIIIVSTSEVGPGSYNTDIYTKSKQNQGYSIYVKNVSSGSESNHDELVVGNNSKLNILGSKEDIEGFRRFVKNYS
jgi:hypothetical protein